MVKPNHVTYICWTIVASCSFWFGRARSPLFWRNETFLLDWTTHLSLCFRGWYF